MVAKNPYIVKETEGNAYTIRQYVTGRPLTAGELLPDEHGIYPVNPLGFGMTPDGSELQEADPTAVMLAYPIYYGDMYGIPAPTPEEEGNVVPPEVLYGYVKYHLVGPYSVFSGKDLKFPVISVTVDEEDPSVYVVVAAGDIRDCDDESRTANLLRFYNSTSDDYGPTGLTSEEGFRIDSVEVENGVSTIRILNQQAAPFAGIVGPGKLGMAIVYDKSGEGPDLVSIRDNAPDSANGIFLVGKLDGEPFRKVCELPAPEAGGDDDGTGDDVPECNARNGYGSSEVRDWITGRVGGIVGYGTHPSKYPGDLTDAGAFVQWFVSCADIDVSGGMGNNQVMVPGFGLGSGYFQTCVSGARVPEGKPATDVTNSQWITFGYGTSHDDTLTNNNSQPALPMDWPFTDNSDFANTTIDNNITLVRKGVDINGTVYGRLERVDPECPRCSGNGNIEKPDGTFTPCPICNGSGQVPMCSECGGTGKVADKECPKCMGSGCSKTCDFCRGTGDANGYRCKVCGGTGTIHGTNVNMNKVHVCLFNDFKPSGEDEEGHEAGTTVLKKTFVNLATPITTKDGDEMEITVSLPNVSLDKAFNGEDTTDLKNLSGYYAYISQPRVYVMSGSWKFSETAVEFTISSDLTKVTLDKEFLDTDGNPLPDDTDVRVKLTFGAYTNKVFDMNGVLKHDEGNPVVELYDSFDVNDNVKRILAIPPTRKAPNRICGAAYVEPNNDTMPVDATPLGLNAVRNMKGSLGVDYGDAEGTVEQYNKLYTAVQDDDSRHHVLFDDEGNPKNDQRQVVATVYPTVTNTFPWALTHRRKQNFLEKIMTMDAELGCNSVFAKVFDMNRGILETVNSLRPSAAFKYYLFEVTETEYSMNPESYPDGSSVCYIRSMFLRNRDNNVVIPTIKAENSFVGAAELFVEGYQHSPWVSNYVKPDENSTGWFIMEFDAPVDIRSYQLRAVPHDMCVCEYPRSWRLCGSNSNLSDPHDPRWELIDAKENNTSLNANSTDEDLYSFGVTRNVPTYNEAKFKPAEYPLNLEYGTDYIASKYESDISDKISFIGAVMSVLQSSEPLPDIEAQPVRQAIKAVKMLSHDYRNSRAKWRDYTLTSGSSIFADADPIASDWDISGKETIPINASNKYDQIANKIRLSHLPEFIAAAGTSETGEPISPMLNVGPYIGEEYAYYYGNPYDYDEYGTTDKISDTDCEVASNESTRVFSVNSIVTACTEKDLPWLRTTGAYDDLLRSAELAAINFNDSDVLSPLVFHDSKTWYEPFDSFTKILSPDNIPVPHVEETFTYENAGLSDSQYAFVAGDAYGYYKLLNDWASLSDGEFISTNMPTDDSLAQFLKDYVSSYGACMTMRHWDGFRVTVKKEPTESDKKTPTYLTRMAWNGAGCEDSYRGEYAIDAFIVDNEYVDPNLNRVMFDTAYDALSMNYSVPPYSCSRDYSKIAPFATSSEQDAVGYIRVYMKFSFCADAGRWYCIDYRQAPISYLSPLYGAKALEETINEKPIWIPPGCGTFSWREAASHTYEEYRPMDINPALVSEIVSPRVIMAKYGTFLYTPGKNKENSCMSGQEFEPNPELHTYHVSLDLVWRNFSYLDFPENFDCRFQGARYRPDTESWVWTGANQLCTALNNVKRPKELILSSPSGTYHYEADFNVPSTWFDEYSKCMVGLRTDYSNGRGNVGIRNLVVTNIRTRLALPYLPVDQGGLGLNAPLTKEGVPSPDYENMAHANFWSVRPHLRPATGAVPVGAIPHYYRDEEMYKHYEDDGGIMADAVLWGQYDYPEKNAIEYHLPDTIYPDVDWDGLHLVYAERNNTTKLMDSGHIQCGNHPNIILGVAMPGEGGNVPLNGGVIIAKKEVDITVNSDEDNLGYK